jgi:hypothetical protein
MDAATTMLERICPRASVEGVKLTDVENNSELAAMFGLFELDGRLFFTLANDASIDLILRKPIVVFHNLQIALGMDARKTRNSQGKFETPIGKTTKEIAEQLIRQSHSNIELEGEHVVKITTYPNWLQNPNKMSVIKESDRAGVELLLSAQNPHGEVWRSELNRQCIKAGYVNTLSIYAIIPLLHVFGKAHDTAMCIDELNSLPLKELLVRVRNLVEWEQYISKHGPLRINSKEYGFLVNLIAYPSALSILT